MARINKNEPVDAMFAYNVAKDIVNLENEIEVLKNQPVPRVMEVENRLVATDNAVYRQVKNLANIKLVQTGYRDGIFWYGDRPNDGYWLDPFTQRVYLRRDNQDSEVELPSPELVRRLNISYRVSQWGELMGYPLSDDSHVLNMDFEEFKKISIEAGIFVFENLNNKYKTTGLFNLTSAGESFKLYYLGVEVYSGIIEDGGNESDR
ncbi:hypothetical protein BKG91_03580 [Rodentibacter caecimuris]|uniref:Uncharacterized protein n=1 Tax=Rodentibacter caecimuris TaxID=1796644 RepID=A0AAJ3K1X4_9PAST|nr:hypothetical protein [Rodentibacter heylii]AOF54284.1 hypothetical protein AC062_2197 [Pasteurellaceae bacterium NI1060]OOF70041.1 hypothetical protein BKG90_11205 [Rodentibacter heylii]OOF75410.1 hypothetical protein BKG91_03580 [Rodentibacter heylii]OOF76265.1 hypothetical protein BKG99_06640 [Rodentibacter heylii]